MTALLGRALATLMSGLMVLLMVILMIGMIFIYGEKRAVPFVKFIFEVFPD